MPDDPRLLAGRTVWAGTCQACHGLGEAGSPKITDNKAWAPRIAKGVETLREHALKGIIGPTGTMMPERGGNPELTDQQIFAAIDYMVANSR
jgi:cytochrome c5